MSSSSLVSLEELLRTTTSSGEPEFKFALGRLSIEIKDRLQRPLCENSEEFFGTALRVLSRIKGGAHAELRMCCLFDSALFLYINGYNEKALYATRLLDDLSHRSNLQFWILRAESAAGVVHAELGNIAESVVRHANSLRLAVELHDPCAEVGVLCNLGVALNYGGLYKEAIPCLERAALLARSDAVERAAALDGRTDRYLEPIALTNLAQSHYFLEDFETGFNVITECLQKSQEPKDAISALGRVVRESTYVLFALELGKFESAREHAAACQIYARIGGARAHVMAQIAAGLCEVEAGDAERGLAILEASLVESGNITSLRTDALLALVRVLDKIDQPQRALAYIREVIEKIKSARKTGALALLAVSEICVSYRSRIAAESEDLRGLKLTEANLRARVAEHEIVSTSLETLERLAIAADLKEEPSGEHGYRVGRLAMLIAKDLGWTEDACHALELAARLHDVGKIALPDSILLKSSDLLATERHFLDAHAALGAELLSKSGMPHFLLAEEIAGSHHEWWNGSGYPSRFAGTRIPLHARIVALADVFDALTHGRPYADAWPAERAILEIHNRRGSQFDPHLTDRFLDIISNAIRQHGNLDHALGNNSSSSTFVVARKNIRRLLAKESDSVRRETSQAATVCDG
jgi:putative two-component system response regulator